MKIAFNPSTVAALTTPPNNKDITFDLRGRNIFARGVKFLGTDTWRDIKINNVSIDSNILDLRNGSNTTLTNTNGVVTINSTWRPVVDNLTSDSTTSSLSAKQGKVLKSLIDGKSNSGHTHDDRYLKLTGGTMASNALITFADSGSWGTNKEPQGARGGLYWSGQSDYAKLYAEETAGDNLDLVIQFGDDNSNGLSIRNKANTQTSYISAGGVITTGTFKGNLDWSYITNKPATATRWPSWAEVTGKPSSFTPSTHTHGLSNPVFFLNMPSISGNAKWKEVFGYPVNYNLLLSVRINNPAPEWCAGNYGSGILYGGGDTKGFMSSAYNEPLIMWAGGNGSSDDSVPKWYIGIKGIHKSIYNLATIASEANDAYNLRHSHANKSVLDGITSALVNNWNTAFTFVNTITGADTDKVINKWDEIVNFLAGITEDNKLNTLLNSKLSVYELANNTNVGAIKNNGIYYSTSDASSGTLTNSPFNTGFALINMTSYDGGDDLRRSRLAFNAYGEIKVSDDRDYVNTAETWYNVLTSKNSGISGSTIKLNGTSITVYSSSTADGRYVKKSGDTMSGALNFANNAWNNVGDDVAIGDHNVAGCLGIKGLNGSPGLAFYNSSNTLLSKLVGTANLFLRVSGNNTYNILDTSTTLVSDGKGIINGTTITQVDNADKLDGYHAYQLFRDLGWWNSSETHNANNIEGNASVFAYITHSNVPTTGVLTTFSGGNDAYNWQMAKSYNWRGLYIRQRDGDNSTWSNWVRLLDENDLVWDNIAGKPSTFNPAAHTHTVFNNNLMIKGTNGISDSASIHLGIGDSDTGFKWISDGKCLIYANNSAVGEWTSGGMNWFKNPTVNGNKIWNAGNDGSGSGLDADLLDGWHLDSIRKNVGYSWSAKYRINNWSRIIKIDNYSNILLAINFAQSNQASNHLYLISTGYGCGNIVQLGANGYNGNSAIKIRLTENTETSHNVEIYSTYGYNGATELSINCNYTRIDGNSTITTYLTYTAGGGTIRKEITSSYSKIVANLQGNSDTTTKLQTPRQINGTNFDGTSNITTSYWGATRTISLTGAVTGSVSTNGSGNITINTTYGTGNITNLDNRYVKKTGDTMLGNLAFASGKQTKWTAHGTSYITDGNADIGTSLGGDLANLVISSWNGVSFTTSCSGQTYTNKTAVGINCRTGIVYAANFVGTLQGNASSASKLQTARKIWGQSFDGTADISGTLSGVAHILFSADNTYNIGSNSAASKYIYTYWLGAKSGLKLELGANNSSFGLGLCIDTNLNVGIGTNIPAYKLDVRGDIRATGQIIREGSSWTWVNGRRVALLRETTSTGYHTLWSLKTTNGSWDFGEYNSSGWNNIPVLSYITDTNFNSSNNTTTYQIKFPLDSGTIALTKNIPTSLPANGGNADTVDGYHANGLLTALSNSNNGVSITIGGTTKSISNISVNYASSAGSTTKVIVNLHTNNDTNYPLVWSNLSNTNNVTENQLYKSWSDLYYNPKNKRLTVGGSVVASSFVKSGGTSLQLLRADGGIATFNWSGQSGLPTWLWGGNNLHSYYVYNPSNFRVAYASSAGNATTSTKSEYSRSLLGRNTSGNDYDTNSSNLVFAEWNTMSDSRWYLKATGYECRVAYANNADTVDGTHLNGIFTAFGNNDHNITATIGGVTKSFLVNWAADSDKLDGYHADKYLMVPTTIDATSLNSDTYYPVTILLPCKNTRIEVEVSLDSGTKPSWSTHQQGFTSRKVWESNGSGWGTTSVERNIFVSTYSYASEDPIRGIGQLTSSSNEFVYVRGGGKYYFRVSVGGGIPTLRKENYTINSQSISPTKTAPDLIVPCINTPHRRVTLWGQSFDGTNSVSGSLSNTGTITASTAATYDIGSNALDYRNGYFQWIGAKSNTNLRLAANNSDNQIVLHTNGNVGIDIASPAYKLHVVGDIYTTTGFKKNGSSNSYILLGGGGHKLISDFATSNHTHSNYVTALGTNGNYLTWTKNGSTNNITVPYATTSSYLTNGFSAVYINKWDCNAPDRVVYSDYGSSGRSIANAPSGWYYGTLLELGHTNYRGINGDLNILLMWDVAHNTTLPGTLWFRGKDLVKGWAKSWAKVITDLNISSILSNYYTKSETDGKYVTLTTTLTIGGSKTFTTGIKFNVNNNGDANLGSGDGFKLFYNQTSGSNFPGNYYNVASFITGYTGFLLACYGGSDLALKYRHRLDNGTWHPWKTLAFTTDIPTSLKNPYALTISLNGTSQGSYDGSAAKSINITPGSIGAATSGHNHDGRYLTLSGGTMTGTIRFNNLINTGSAIVLDYKYSAGGFARDIVSMKNSVYGDANLGALSILCYPDSTSNGFLYIYLGTDKYDGPNNLRIYKDKVTFGNNILIDAGNIGSLSVAYASKAGAVAWANVTGKPSSFTPSAHDHNYVLDIANNSHTTFAYSKSGLSKDSITWLAVWNGYELRAMNKDQVALSGHTHDDRYLKLTGGTMTGNISYKGSKNTYEMIRFVDNNVDIYGNGICIGGGGLTIIGGGDSASEVLKHYTNGGEERMIIANDTAIDFFSNMNSGWDSRKAGSFDTSGYWNGVGFKKNNSNDNYVLTGGGGHKAISSLSVNYATSAGYVSNSLNIFGVSYNGSAAKTVTTSTFISLLSEGTSTVTDGTMFITSYASNSGFADTNAVNVPYKRKASYLWNYIDSKVSSKYLPLAGGTMNGNARIGHGSGNLYIGSADNNGWVMTQDIASQSGTDKWYIKTSGASCFGNIHICSNSDGTYDSSVIECYNDALYLNYYSSTKVILCKGGGSVGIGTVPAYKLDVVGSGYFSDTVYSNTLNHTSSTGHLIIGNKTKEISIRSSDLPDVPAVYLLKKFSTNVYYTANKGFGIRPYYLSSASMNLMETISGNKYTVVKVGDDVLAISCIIADKVPLMSQIKGTLIRFLPGDDGLIVLLKDLNNYGNGNGYLYVLPKNCNIVRSDNSNIFIADGNISSAYDDGKSRFFIYAKTYNIWIEFYCG